MLVDTYRLALCAAVGAATGVIAIGFRSAVGVIEHGLAAVADGLRDAQESALAGVLVVAGPAVGGLVVGLLVYRLIRLRGGHGVPAVITAAAADRPMSDWRMGVKASSSIITIGSGGSVGPEGPIVELGAVFGSYAWKVFRLPGQWVRIMMGCGAAAGIAAIFNVPLGGVIFVLDVVLRDYSLRSLVPLMVASMSASIVTRYAGTPAVQLPAYTLGGDEMLCAPIIGLLAGLVSTLFIRANFFAADMFKRLPAPIWLRPAVGGLCVGLIGLGMARVHGEGYTAIEQMVVNAAGTNPAALVVLALLAFCLAKILATAATLGSGGTGGAFAPSLVIGTALGLASAGMWPRLVPGAELNPAACALIGMAGLLGGVFQAPLSGVVIAFNLSRWNAQLLLPLMCVAVISAWLSQHLARASIYDLSLLREGVDLAASRSLQNILAGRGIDDLIRTPVISVHEEATLGQMIDALSQSTQVVFPVVDARDTVRGVIRVSELRKLIRESQLDQSVIAADLMEPLSHALKPSDSLAATWNLFCNTTDEEILVLDQDGGAAHHPRALGLVRRSEVIRHTRWS